LLAASAIVFPVKVRLNVRKKCSLRNCNIGIDAPARNRYRAAGALNRLMDRANLTRLTI